MTFKKLLPIILFLAGLLVLGGVFFFIVRSTKETAAPSDETETVAEVALMDRPVASLTPSSDGHWITMKVEKIKLTAKTMDYELLYSLPDGRTQGVPGSVTLASGASIERKLLLGSESSGKFRYDEGVTEGTLTLKFRSSEGKLVAKFLSAWHLQSSPTEISSVDGKIKISLKKAPAKTFIVTMNTFGVPDTAPAELKSGPWGVFSSSGAALSATVDLGTAKAYLWSQSKWVEITSTNFKPGILIGTD